MAKRFITRIQKNPVLENVRIRMYRQGLGDCFLLSFTNQLQKTYHLMIDCGVLPFSGGDGRLQTIIQKVFAETGGHLDAVAITHEHADHISGFADKYFKWIGPDGQEQQPTIDQVWMAWTEDFTDNQVKSIIQKVNALSFAAIGSGLAMAGDERAEVQQILRFQGIELAADGSLGAAGQKHFDISVSLDKIMTSMRGRVKKPLYLNQQSVISLDDFGIRVYCLGPSREMPMLGGQPQTNGAAAAPGMKLNPVNAFLAAAANFAGQNLASGDEKLPDPQLDDLFENSMPFSQQRMLKVADIKQCLQPDNTTIFSEEIQKTADFFDRYYGVRNEDTTNCPEWRRIDSDWLLAGGQMALQQVSIVNNTSLVLAIELVETGKVLLFVGDAEEDNWKMWKNSSADVKDLLARTVVYKVGHHGSINATDPDILKNQITNPELVALIPADVEVAHSKKSKTNPDGWQFPDPSLYNLQATVETEKGLLYSQAKGKIILNCVDDCPSCRPSYDLSRPWPGYSKIVEDPDKLWVDYILNFC